MGESGGLGVTTTQSRIEEIELGFGTHATPFQITWPRMFVGDTRMKVTERLFRAVVRKVRRRFGVYYIPRPAPRGVSLHALNGFTILAGTMRGTRPSTDPSGPHSTATASTSGWKRSGLEFTKTARGFFERACCCKSNPKLDWVELGETYLLKAPGFAKWILQDVAPSSHLRKFSIAADDLRRTFPNTHQAVLTSVSDVVRDHLTHLILNGINRASDLQCMIPFVAGLKWLRRLEIWSEDSASAGPQPFAQPSDFVGVEVAKENLEARYLRHLDARMEILLYLSELTRVTKATSGIADPRRVSSSIGLPKLKTIKVRYDIDAMHKSFEPEELMSSLGTIEEAFSGEANDGAGRRIEITLSVRGRNLNNVRSKARRDLTGSAAALEAPAQTHVRNIEWAVYAGDWDKLQSGELDDGILGALEFFPNLHQIHFLPAYQIPLPNKPLDCPGLRERLQGCCPKLERVCITKA
jgi:hypothetical protein